ncbi:MULTISPECIES: TetR/AcrR family transcriptional regulator [Pectobacterium]|uniref:TetR/AcrR family transcriptional regulator n=1 Tax=Pectobacterium TaxID=122277 RepID=UPI0015DEFF97|nr:TetR/AcrR family transcriptional regulator [Pectobacterium sp. CFBP8739]MBA0167040.1 TetR/AcrR family transcriptional regulator [Pectobacterium sp. CFBP8739]
MTNAHRRKKDPEKVRLNLIESAKKLALEKGFGAVSLEAVALDAGVTKGGLFHHFTNKHALVSAVFEHLLQEFKHDLITRMSSDPDPYGRFTRAYVQLVFETGADSDYGPLWITTLSVPELRMIWGKWLNDLLQRYGETELQLENARFAADGIWLGHMFGVTPQNIDAFMNHLIDMTRAPK